MTGKRHFGFGAMEVLIIFIVIAALGAFALPAFINYSHRLYYAEILTTVAPYKTGVEECFKTKGVLKDCSGGKKPIPADIKKPTGAVAMLTVVNGVITVQPVALHGILVTDTYVATPTVVDKKLKWVETGGAVDKAYAP